jgi:SPP1 family predicted phage head-tail adaptor
VQAGKLRHRVTFQKNSGLKDATGSRKPIWDDVCTINAEINPLSAREVLASKAVMSDASVKIIIRYRSDITSAMRIKYKDTIYSIVGEPINPNMRNRELQIMCSVGLNKG